LTWRWDAALTSARLVIDGSGRRYGNWHVGNVNPHVPVFIERRIPTHCPPRDFADEHPEATVIGTDISPIQPSWVPPNLRFEIEDATQPWTFAPDTFDFVHMRYLFGAFTDWNAAFAEAYKVLKPGGWLESFEASSQFHSDDGSLKEGSPMDQWAKVFTEAGKKFGRSFSVINDNVQLPGIEAAGFVDIKVVEGKVSCSPVACATEDKTEWRGLIRQHRSL